MLEECMANPTLEQPVKPPQATSSVDLTAITRDELKVRVVRGGDFKLMETLPPEQARYTNVRHYAGARRTGGL
jgi:hypothetical protein